MQIANQLAETREALNRLYDEEVKFMKDKATVPLSCGNMEQFLFPAGMPTSHDERERSIDLLDDEKSDPDEEAWSPSYNPKEE